MADPQFCLLAIDHWAMCMNKAEWSGWVQAIGSIAAIAAGSIGIAWQVQRQSRLATDLERKNAESLTARALVDHLSGIEGAVQLIRSFEDWRTVFLNGHIDDIHYLESLYVTLFDKARERLRTAADVDYPLLKVKHLCRRLEQILYEAHFAQSTTYFTKSSGQDWRSVLAEAPKADADAAEAIVERLKTFVSRDSSVECD